LIVVRNVGIGVTPPSSATLFDYLFVNGIGVAGLGTEGGLYNNAYYDGSAYKRINTGYASRIYMASDSSLLYDQASTSSAGTDVTFSTALKIDSSGNVGIGATTIDETIHVEVTGGDAALKLEDAAGGYMRIDQNSVGATNIVRFKSGGSLLERMRIDSAGYVGMGVTNPSAYSSRLVLNSLGTYTLWQTSTGVTRGVFGSSESGGQNWTYSTAGTGNYGSANGDLIWQNGSNVTFMRFDQSATTVVGDFVDTSDVGLKENIVDTTDGLTKIMQLQPRKFDWKEENKQQQVNGFIAQELETILPNEVSGDDYDEENPDHGHKAINTSGVLAVAVKAIQEQQTIIESLEARITALES
jgi:hypothetical protein